MLGNKRFVKLEREEGASAEALLPKQRGLFLLWLCVLATSRLQLGLGSTF